MSPTTHCSRGVTLANVTWPTSKTLGLDRVIDAAIRDQRIVGTVVMVAQGGKRVYCRAAGDADREEKHPMTPTTPFRLASVTKAFTALAAIRLMSEGKLHWKDPVTAWLPWFRPIAADGTQPHITVAHLLTHTAGLDYGFQQLPQGLYQTAGVSDGIDDSQLSLKENLSKLATVPLDLLPGQAWRYSVATDVLGAVVAAANQSTLETAIDTLLTSPLELDASFHWQGPALATPYYNSAGAPRRMAGKTRVPLPDLAPLSVSFDPQRIAHLLVFPSGGGGMAASADSVLRLLECYRQGALLPAPWTLAARLDRLSADMESMYPGWGFAWLGGYRRPNGKTSNPALPTSPLSPGSVCWGGVYGHSWAMDFQRDLTLVCLTNTTFEGVNGRYPAQVLAAACAAAEP